MASDTNVSSATFESRLTTLETNFAVFVQEMKDFKEEMREFKSEVREFKGEMKTLGSHVRNISIAAFAGIGAMVVTSVIGIAAMVWSVISKG